MLARRDRRSGLFGVQEGGRGDGHHIDIRVGRQTAPVAGRAGEAQGASLLRRARRRGGRDDLAPHVEAKFIDGGNLRQRDGICLAHVARADDAEAEFVHVVRPFHGGGQRRNPCGPSAQVAQAMSRHDSAPWTERAGDFGFAL